MIVVTVFLFYLSNQMEFISMDQHRNKQYSICKGIETHFSECIHIIYAVKLCPPSHYVFYCSIVFNFFLLFSHYVFCCCIDFYCSIVFFSCFPIVISNVLLFSQFVFYCSIVFPLYFIQFFHYVFNCTTIFFLCFRLYYCFLNIVNTI